MRPALRIDRFDRETLLVLHSMRRGVNSLDLVIAAAPLVGSLGALFMIAGSFRGVSGNGGLLEYMRRVMGYLAEALIPMEAGLLIGLLTIGIRHFLLASLDRFRVELLGPIRR